MASKPMRTARLAEFTNASRTRAMSSSVATRGTCQPAPKAIGDGAMVSHGSAPGLSAPPPSHGRCAERLAAGMRDLDAELGGADAAAVRDHARHRRLVVVGIEPGAAVGDAAVALDVGRLDDHEAGAAIGQHAEMAEVPVVGAAVVGAVLAHRRDHDAVGKLEAGQAKGEKRALVMGRILLKGG